LSAIVPEGAVNVADFVALIPREGCLAECEELLSRPIRISAGGCANQPQSNVRTAWCVAISFARENGSGSAIAVDPTTGSWLAALGTWFHDSGAADASYLLERYLSDGAERFALEVNGFFAIVAGNATTRQVVVLTDVVGSLHLYCRQLPFGVAISTSSIALARLSEVTLDPIGCKEFLQTGVMYEDRTFYKEVRKLAPASITTFSNGHLNNRRQYWSPVKLTPESLSAADATDALWEALGSAVRKINSHYDRVVCDLTGGYDSRGIAAAFLGRGQKFATVVSGPSDSGDVRISTGLATKFGLEHLHYPRAASGITPEEMQWALRLTDGECDLSEYIHVARIHKDLSRQFAISINGSFGEIARGYWWELLFPRTGSGIKLDSRKLAMLRYAVGSQNTLLQPQYDFDLDKHLTGVVDRAIAGIEVYPNTFQMDVAYLRMRMQRWQGRLASSTDRIWPCLSPFMFRPVLETMLQAHHGARERSFLIRRMLAKYQPSLAAYPLEHGYPALPANWKNLPRFWPLVPYYAGRVVNKIKSRVVRHPKASTTSEHRQIANIEEMLNPSSMRLMELLDREKVESLLSRSRQPGFSQERELTRLLTLESALSPEILGEPDGSRMVASPCESK
jgi:asparagine synthase (glutamine-hydrolysing)